jgi:Aspartate/ornithine carbamoyltransferase, carbamoyl-P binding domain
VPEPVITEAAHPAVDPGPQPALGRSDEHIGEAAGTLLSVNVGLPKDVPWQGKWSLQAFSRILFPVHAWSAGSISKATAKAIWRGAYDQGARVTYLGPEGSHIGTGESIKDTARVLGRMFDGIEYRGFAQQSVETLAQFSGVPVWTASRTSGIPPRCWPTS